MKTNLKLLFVAPILILFTLLSQAQPKTGPVNYEYFLLGSLNDYMGRQKYTKVLNRVDEYYDNNKALAVFLDSVFKSSYPDLVLAANKQTKRMELHSASLAQKINEFYMFEKSTIRVYNGEKDEKSLNVDSLVKTPDYLSKHFEFVYTGRLVEGIFQSDVEKLSFLAGAYTRFGGVDNNLYYIRVFNSNSKAEVLRDVLRDLKCTNVEYVVSNDNIPVPHTVYFTPSNALKNYFDAVKLQNL